MQKSVRPPVHRPLGVAACHSRLPMPSWKHLMDRLFSLLFQILLSPCSFSLSDHISSRNVRGHRRLPVAKLKSAETPTDAETIGPRHPDSVPPSARACKLCVQRAPSPVCVPTTRRAADRWLRPSHGRGTVQFPRHRPPPREWLGTQSPPSPQRRPYARSLSVHQARPCSRLPTKQSNISVHLTSWAGG